LVSENHGEFTSKEFMNFYGKHGIKRKFSATNKPQQNKVTKRKNKTVQEMARTMLEDSKSGDIFWAHEVHTLVHILNTQILRINSAKTPYEP
jgi:transposase InsO family protein